MDQRNALRDTLTAIFLVSAIFCTQNVPAAGSAQGGKVRTYYVAADEVEWNYAPSGRDEAMGMPFDDIAKGYTQSGPPPDRSRQQESHLSRIHRRHFYRPQAPQLRKRAIWDWLGPFFTLKWGTRSELFSKTMLPILTACIRT